MKWNLSRRGVLVAGAAVVTGCATSPDDAVCRTSLPEPWSGVVLVEQGGARSVKAQGRLHPDGPLIHADTRFNILSLGKMMTGVLVGQLVDAGRVQFDDRVSRHLPELPPRIGDLKVGDLLNHTSGLGNYIEERNFVAIAAVRSASDLLHLVIAAENVEPGTHAYSNGGYAVAGAVIERLMGTTFEDALHHRIFAPCQMRSASLTPRIHDALPAAGIQALRSNRLAVSTLPGGPPGGAFMTGADLARFANALLAGRLLSDATRTVITSVQAERQPPAADGVRRGWGFGFGVTGEGPDRSIGHTGGLPGAGAALRIRLSTGRLVVALANQDTVNAADVSREAMNDEGFCRPTSTG